MDESCVRPPVISCSIVPTVGGFLRLIQLGVPSMNVNGVSLRQVKSTYSEYGSDSIGGNGLALSRLAW